MTARRRGDRSPQGAGPTRSALLTILMLSALTVPAVLHGQDGPPAAAASDSLVELRLADGSTLVGRIISETADRIVFETTGGARVEVDRAQIRSIRTVRGAVVDGEFMREDPNRTRLLILSPTGRTLHQGEAYLSTFWIVLPFVGYGVTDAFTMAGGTPILPEVIGRVIYLAPKLRVAQTPSMDLAVGGIAFFATEAIDEGSLGIAYGVGTFGDADRSVTGGLGWGWALGGGDAWVSNDPLVMLGGEYRTGRGSKLLTENFFVLGESAAIVSGGFRLFREQLSVDFGIAAVLGDGDGIPWFPVLNFVYVFGGPHSR